MSGAKANYGDKVYCRISGTLSLGVVFGVMKYSDDDSVVIIGNESAVGMPVNKYHLVDQGHPADRELADFCRDRYERVYPTRLKEGVQ